MVAGAHVLTAHRRRAGAGAHAVRSGIASMTSKQQDREDLAWKIAESHGPGVYPIFTVRDCAEQTYFSEVAQTKRLLERYAMDDRFHAACDADAQTACDEYGIDIDAEAVRLLWDEATAADVRKANEAGGTVPEMPLPVRRYQSFIAEKLAFRDWMRDAKSGVSGQFGLWRLQQMHRCTLELGADKNSGLVHAKVAFELQ